MRSGGDGSGSSRPDPARLDPARYAINETIGTRYQDLDTNRHLNNVAFAALFESARVNISRRTRPPGERPKGERSVVVQVTIDYLGEGSFPEPVEVHSAVGRIGGSSFTIVQLMTQAGRPIATSATVVAVRRDGAASPLRDDVRAALAALAFRAPAAADGAAGSGA